MKIKCFTLSGKEIWVNQEELSFRISVYGIIIYKNTVLLVKGRTSKKYWFPGGGVNIGENIETTLKREILEETGLQINNFKFISFKEEFFYHDNWEKGFHSIRFYYQCLPITNQIISNIDMIDGESEYPQWVEINQLSGEDFDQFYGYFLLQESYQLGKIDG